MYFRLPGNTKLASSIIFYDLIMKLNIFNIKIMGSRK